jgi:hypothetical protein
MGAYDTALLNALLADTQQQYTAAESPIYSAGTNLMQLQPKWNGYADNPTSDFLLQAFTAPLAGGLMRGFGEQQITNELRPQYKGLLSSFGADQSVIDKVDAPGWEPQTFKTPLVNALAESQREQDLTDAIEKAVLPKIAEKQAMTGGIKIGVDENGRLKFVVKEGGEAFNPMGGTGRNPFAQDTRKPFAQKLAELTQYFIEQGSTPAQASQSARATLAPDALAQKAGQLRVEAANKQAADLESFAQTVDAGVSGAGSWTGPIAGPLSNLGLNVASMVSGDASRMLKARQMFEEPSLLKALSVRQPGATSEAEMRKYLKAGPTTSNTPETNRAIADRAAQLAGIQRDYAEFVDTYLREGYSVNEAEQKWANYKKSFPLFVEGPNGDVQVNTQRPDWRLVIAGELNTNNASVPTPQGPPPGSIDTGKKSGGKPVYQTPEGKLFVVD